MDEWPFGSLILSIFALLLENYSRFNHQQDDSPQTFYTRPFFSFPLCIG
jgi:hypothetical protein